MVFFQTKAGYRTHNLQEFICCFTFPHLSWASNGIMMQRGISLWQTPVHVRLKLYLISELFIVNNWPTAYNESILMMQRLTKLHYVRMAPLTQPSCRVRLTGFVAYMVLAALGAQLTPSLPVRHTPLLAHETDLHCSPHIIANAQALTIDVQVGARWSDGVATLA